MTQHTSTCSQRWTHAAGAGAHSTPIRFSGHAAGRASLRQRVRRSPPSSRGWAGVGGEGRSPAPARPGIIRSPVIRSESSRSNPTTSPTGRRRCASAWVRGPSLQCWKAATGWTYLPPVLSLSCARYLDDVSVTTVPSQAPQASQHWPTSIYRRPDGTVEEDVSPPRMREILQACVGELWTDIDSTSMHQHALLEKVFEFHPLAIEDTLSPGTRVKLEEYDRYIFVVMAGGRFDASA